MSDTPADENARNDQPWRRQQPGRPSRGGDSSGAPRAGDRGRQGGDHRANGGASRDRSSSGGAGSWRGRSDGSESGYRRSKDTQSGRGGSGGYRGGERNPRGAADRDGGARSRDDRQPREWKPRSSGDGSRPERSGGFAGSRGGDRRDGSGGRDSSWGRDRNDRNSRGDRPDRNDRSSRTDRTDRSDRSGGFRGGERGGAPRDGYRGRDGDGDRAGGRPWTNGSRDERGGGAPRSGAPRSGGPRSGDSRSDAPRSQSGGFRRDGQGRSGRDEQLWTREGRPARGDRDARDQGRQYDADAERSRELQSIRPRHDDPIIPEDVQARDLPGEARVELKTLSKDNADQVAKHLVMAGRLIDTDPELAHQHAVSASRRAGRVAVVRETLAITAYATGDFALALRELRTYRRISGSNDQLPLMVDSERGVGRPDRALELGRSVDRSTLPADVQVSLAIAMSGARLDLGQPEAALAELEISQLDPDRAFAYSADLFHAYAEVLEELGRDDDAARWRDRAKRAEIALDQAHASDEDETIDIVEEDIFFEIDDSTDPAVVAEGDAEEDERGRDGNEQEGEPDDGTVSTEQ